MTKLKPKRGGGGRRLCVARSSAIFTVLLLALGLAVASTSSEPSPKGEVQPGQRQEVTLPDEAPGTRVDLAAWKEKVAARLQELEKCVGEAAGLAVEHGDKALPAALDGRMRSCAGEVDRIYMSDDVANNVLSSGSEEMDHEQEKALSSAHDVFLDFIDTPHRKAPGRFTNPAGVKLAEQRFRRSLEALQKMVQQ